jgi:hypothetical protein
MDPLLLMRQAALFAHTVSFAVALGAVLREDLALLRLRQVHVARLAATARVLTGALAVLWVSGLALVALTVGTDLQALLANPKLVAKLLVVSALTLNGLAIHRLAFPMLQQPHGASAALPLMLGAFSTASWLVAAFIGVSRPLAASLHLSHYLALYGAALLVALAVAFLYLRPRISGARSSAAAPPHLKVNHEHT